MSVYEVVPTGDPDFAVRRVPLAGVGRAEPYGLTGDDLADLALLGEDCWEVEVGGAPCHHPTTVVVSIERQAATST